MAGLNKVLLIGRLGSDPESKSINNGNTVCRMSVATSEVFGTGDKKQERTTWHRVVVWGKLAELCGKYLSKGRQVFVEGRIETRSYEDKSGEKKYTTEIIANKVQFLGGNQAAESNSSGSHTEDYGDTPSFDEQEELPF